MAIAEQQRQQPQTLHLIPQTEFERLVTSINQQINDGFNMLKTHMVEKPITKKEAASYLRISLSALKSRIRSGEIPSKFVHKNGGTPYFLPSELHELIKKS